jgi:hypothetical protein
MADLPARHASGSFASSKPGGTTLRETRYRIFLVRQEKPGRGEWNVLKPFAGTQRVATPARKGRPAIRKRVLRGGGATRAIY